MIATRAELNAANAALDHDLRFARLPEAARRAYKQLWRRAAAHDGRVSAATMARALRAAAGEVHAEVALEALARAGLVLWDDPYPGEAVVYELLTAAQRDFRAEGAVVFAEEDDGAWGDESVAEVA